MVILSFFHEDRQKREDILDYLLELHPDLTSLMYVINEKKNDTLYDQDIKVYHGRDHIIEVLEDLKFRIGPKSFFQTNTGQALRLYQKTRELAELSGKEHVYDLYTGTGTIGLFLAGHCDKVTGIESVPEAIEDARLNASLNGIENADFQAGDMKDLLTPSFLKEKGKPDVVITDPPRAGMHPRVIERLLEVEAGKIVYVSCNPYTQARDLELLSKKYSLTEVQPVDMFPHTHHVENIVRLDLK
jgi:23S rRNA (uracil1939-C5)-methyltransferase